MPEDTPTCQIHEKYDWIQIECSSPALPGDPDGLCILHSRDKAKDPGAFRAAILDIWNREDTEDHDLRGVFFHVPFNPKDFLGTREFKKSINFSASIFTEVAEFFDVTFVEEAYFVETTFIGVADFSRANFTKDAAFSGATFTKGAGFDFVTFTAGAEFIGTTFMNVADFFRTTFSKEVHFIKAIFMEEAGFTMAIIDGRVHFQDLNPSGEVEPPRAFQGRFRNLEFSLGAVLRFQDLSLAKTQFMGTDLRRVEFHHVQWHSYRGRQAFYDEVLLRQKELIYPIYADTPPSVWTDSYGEIERLYRDLQENYEKARDYKRMGDFHYGEMEMHRLAGKWRWFPFYWYNLYRVLSGFGERPSWALGWLVAFLVGMAGLVWGLGLVVGNPPHIAGFGDSFIYLLQKVTFQRPTWAEPVGFWGKLVAGFSVLLIPGQAALFLLALRNRLGRRR